jgi:hypothetical protein
MARELLVDIKSDESSALVAGRQLFTGNTGFATLRREMIFLGTSGKDLRLREDAKETSDSEMAQETKVLAVATRVFSNDGLRRGRNDGSM